MHQGYEGGVIWLLPHAPPDASGTALPPEPDQTKRGHPLGCPRIAAVEAGRIELPSCIRSSVASTCVARRLMFPAAGRQAAHCWMSRQRFRAAADGGRLPYPRICDTPQAAPGGLPVEHCWCNGPLGQVTQPGRSCCSRLDVSRVFYQEPEDLGTLPRSHLHNRNRSPPVLQL